MVYRNLKISHKDKRIYLCRAILPPGDGLVIDHIDRNPLNNTRANLRICTKEENNWNKGPHNGKQYKGVCKKRGGYYAGISCKKQDYHLGIWQDPRDAAFMYNLAAIHHHGEFAYINNI